MKNILKKYRTSILIGTCIETVLFVPAFVYALSVGYGHDNMILVFVLNLPSSILGMNVSNFLIHLTGNSTFSGLVMLIITIACQIILWSFISLIIQRTIHKFKSS
jgi:hypothetical protein